MQNSPLSAPITREIWGDIENILLIYVGSAADFALNAELDWLFFTKRLPSNPQLRFIETFQYNQQIIFSPPEAIPALMQQIRAIHSAVEKRRSHAEDEPRAISDKAYREVAHMLIDYGIRGYEYLHRRKLSAAEKDAYFRDMKTFVRLLGVEMAEEDFAAFQRTRDESIAVDLQPNAHTAQLYAAYAKDIGGWRMWVLRQFQRYFIDHRLSVKLNLRRNILFAPLYGVYPLLRNRLLLALWLRLAVKPETRQALYTLEKEKMLKKLTFS